MISSHVTDTVRLTGWDNDWRSIGTSVKALLFGEMIRRAAPIMAEYHSDLFHDASWIDATFAGPVTFDWLVRPSGTNLSTASDPDMNSARIGVKIGAGDGAVFYRVALVNDGGMWSAEFTNVPLSDVAELPPLPAPAPDPDAVPVAVDPCAGRGGHGDPRCGREFGHTGPCDWCD